MADRKVSKKQSSGIQRFVRETVGELRKVSWPTRQEAWQMTKIVLAVLVIMALYLGVIIDGLAGQLLSLLLGG